jgi:preprotein translocase subunit SecF
VFKIVQHRYWFFLLSAVILVPGIISLIVYGLPRAIDFRGGAMFVVAFESNENVTEEGLRQAYANAGIADAQIVEAVDPQTGDVRYQIRSSHITTEAKSQLDTELEDMYGPFTELLFDSVGPSVGREVTRNATIAVAMAALGILLYLSFVFRAVPHPIRYGVCAIIAMLHDVFVVLGLASIMGVLFGWEVDALFLTALLTVIGFSVHDSIVVFDRIRENVGRMRGVPFESVVNHSIIQTLDRSINTQLTAMFTLVAVYVYSQGQLEQFIFWLIVGLVSGTYSSIFNASPLLVVWENRDWQHWFGRGKKKGSAESAA